MPDTRSPNLLDVTADDYPALFQAADRASLFIQKRHLYLTGSVLALLVGGAACGAVSGAFPSARTKTVLAVASTACVALSFVLTAIRQALKPEKLWYGGRAVAESVKSMAWRYMTGAEPYFIGMPAAETDSRFVSDLKALIKDDQLAVGFGSDFSDKPQISARMREVRSASLEQRKPVYVSDRLADQRKWYGAKARKSQRAESWYFVVILVSQAMALAATAFMISRPGSAWNLTGVFSSLASALVAWLQVRQHEELAQSYAAAALELGFIEEEAGRVSNEKDFSAFVADAENAISREHTLWVARRNRGR
jgi:hypothetical protein